MTSATCTTCTVTTPGLPCFGCGTVTSTTPEDQAAQALAAMPTPVLLRAAYALTHRIHEAERVQSNLCACEGAGLHVWSLSAGCPPLREQANDLRASRDLIDAEVLRRTGDR